MVPYHTAVLSRSNLFVQQHPPPPPPFELLPRCLHRKQSVTPVHLTTNASPPFPHTHHSPNYHHPLLSAEWRSADRLRVLREQMRDAVPLVAEANALSKALGKPVVLSLHLVPLFSMFCFPPTALPGAAGATGDQWTEEVPADGLRRRFDREVGSACSGPAEPVVCVCVRCVLE